jgi:hypothetical protein
MRDVPAKTSAAFARLNGIDPTIQSILYQCIRRVLEKYWKNARFVLERFNPDRPFGPYQLGLFD